MKLPTVLALFATTCFAARAAEERPNILLILTDDLGFSDLGCYGSEIPTPNLDRLASKGLRFSQFYNTAKCHSSRVSLLTGRWCRQAGDESMARAVTIPEVLAPAGYFTAMTGKWHLAKDPADFGFQRSFGHLSGSTNYFTGDKTFRLNGQPWPVPEKGFYTTVANVDHALPFLGEARAAKKPWFLYVAFNAPHTPHPTPHAPLQPLEPDCNKHLGRYTGGWDQLHAARAKKQNELKLFGRDLEACPRPDHVPAWDSLSSDIRDWEARRMAAYAALIDRVDQEIGRLLENLATHGDMENTLVLFFSDNGACPYDRVTTGKNSPPYEATTRWTDSTGWAWARNTPFRFYKQNQFEGGIATPAIAHWPAGIKNPGRIDATPAHLVDVLPTLAAVAGARIPDTYPGRQPTPLAGVSLAPVIRGEKLAERPPLHFLFSSDRGLRDGDWKIVSFKGGPWELYNLATDRTELRNLAATEPAIVEPLSKKWHRMTAEVLKAPPAEQKPVATDATPHLHREWTDFSGNKAAGARAKHPKAKRE